MNKINNFLTELARETGLSKAELVADIKQAVAMLERKYGVRMLSSIEQNPEILFSALSEVAASRSVRH